jgi:8-oxo-dGTP pyrophosphatase MutT (NUDIX family)
LISLDLLSQRLQNYQPRRLPGRQWVARCGVVLLIADQGADGSGDGPALLMMRRAERHGDPWSGHVSFPGGRVDATDASTRAAALRELHEETGIVLTRKLQPMGRLSDLLTREHARLRPMVVSPYVYRSAKALKLRPGVEAAGLWWEPLANLCDPAKRETITWRVAGLPLPLPAVRVNGATLWGLSLMMVNELIKITQSAE